MAQATGEVEDSTVWVGLLPAAPARLLLLANRPQCHVDVWKAIGYQVLDGLLYRPGDWAQPPTATRQAIFQVELSFPEKDAHSCAAALVLDLSPRVHPLALFDQLERWLVGDAIVVLTGLRETDPSLRMRNWMDFVVAIGARCGYSEELLPDSYARLDTSGRFVRVLRKTAVPRWQLHHVRREDFEGISTLFQEVFGHPLSRELWNWKYGGGRGNAVVAARNGALIAHYGGMYRDVLLRGTPRLGISNLRCDGSPQRARCHDSPGTIPADRCDECGNLWSIGLRFPQLESDVGGGENGFVFRGRSNGICLLETISNRISVADARALVRHDPADQARVDVLWKAMAHDLREDVVGVRDWQYLEDRYFNHPHNRYELLLVTSRFTGQPLGVVVLRRVDDSCELLDLVAPLGNLPFLIDQVRRVTGMWGLARVYCWVAKNQAQRFVNCDGKEEVLNISIPTSCWTDDLRADVFKYRWWLMSGDTDFR